MSEVSSTRIDVVTAKNSRVKLRGASDAAASKREKRVTRSSVDERSFLVRSYAGPIDR